MTQQTKQEEIKNLQQELNKVDQIRKPIVERIIKLRKEILVEKYENFIPSPESLMNLDPEEYGLIPEVLDKVRDFFNKTICVKSTGYNPLTNQIALKIQLDKHLTLNPQLAEIKSFLPYIKTQEINIYNSSTHKSEKREVKSFGLTDRSLGEYGVLKVSYDYENKEVLFTRTSGITQKIRSSLIEEESFLWIFLHQIHWYKD